MTNYNYELQTGGYIRDSFPFVSKRCVASSFSLLPASPTTVHKDIGIDNIPLPFLAGNERPTRVYLTVPAISCIISADNYATTVISGFLQYQDVSGQYHLVGAIDEALTSAMAFNFRPNLAPEAYLEQERTTNAGNMVFTISSGNSFGSATTINFECLIELGVYLDAIIERPKFEVTVKHSEKCLCEDCRPDMFKDMPGA